MDKKIILTLLIAFIVILNIGFLVVYAQSSKVAQNSDANQVSPGNAPDTNSPEYKAAQKFNTQLENAVKNNDYDTWKSLLESRLTRDNFDQIVVQYKASQNQTQPSQQ